ncbi:MAG: acyltransferase family protein [Bdellovibrionales bacterium]|nr:acyltransferase family protein [Bdellovibrionales bacterium]
MKKPKKFLSPLSKTPKPSKPIRPIKPIKPTKGKKLETKPPQSLSQKLTEKLLYKILPHFFLEIIRKYLRLEVVGIGNIPKTGAVIVAPNHSGFSGFDAILINYIITEQARRIPRVMSHHLWFLTETTSIPAHKLGFVEATYDNGIDLLRRKNVIVLFPEGESGNFKPSSEMYQLQEFKRGFVRMALETGAPIVPCVVIGAEETHINLSQIKFTKFLRGPILPLPLNLIPLPAKWKICFLEPIYLPYDKDAVHDYDLVHEIAEDIQEKMQEAVLFEIRKRSSVFF